MNIKFSGMQIELTGAMQDYAKSKLARVERHMDNISHIDIVVKKQSLNFVIEALLHNETSNFPQVHARADSEDYYSAIDLLETKLIRQVEKIKNKRMEARRQHN